MNRIEEAVGNLKTYQILWDNLQKQYEGKKKGESYAFRRDQIRRKILAHLEKLKNLVTSVPIWYIKWGDSPEEEIITAGQTEEELRSILSLLSIGSYVITQIKRENIQI